MPLQHNIKQAQAHKQTLQNHEIQTAHRMPRYEDEERPYTRRRGSSASISPAEDKQRSRRSHRDRDRGSERDQERGHDRAHSPHDNHGHRRRSRSAERSKTEGRSRRRHRSRSPRRRRDTNDRSDRRRDDERFSSRRHRRSVTPDAVAPTPYERSKAPLPSQNEAFTNTDDQALVSAPPPPEKEKPNYGTTGRLAAESNKVEVEGGKSIVLKYHEPPEARKPPAKDDWRLYVFKGKDLLETVSLSTRTCWLFGREQVVVDFPVEHPSCSKQHAVVQFRHVEKKIGEFGEKKGFVKPYLIDLESANGTKVNGEEAPKGRYMELIDQDVITFGNSTREYVLMLAPSN